MKKILSFVLLGTLLINCSREDIIISSVNNHLQHHTSNIKSAAGKNTLRANPTFQIICQNANPDVIDEIGINELNLNDQANNLPVCPVCMDEIEPGDEASTSQLFDCQPVNGNETIYAHDAPFHIDCLEHSQQTLNECPICRAHGLYARRELPGHHHHQQAQHAHHHDPDFELSVAIQHNNIADVYSALNNGANITDNLIGIANFISAFMASELIRIKAEEELAINTIIKILSAQLQYIPQNRYAELAIGNISNLCQ